MSKIKAAFFNSNAKVDDGPSMVDYVYAHGRKAQVAQMTSLYPHVINASNWDEHRDRLQDTEVIFSTWGMPPLEREQLDRLPRLRALFYAAGSVKQIAGPFLERDITVVSAWAANAVSVAEFCLAQILLACKGYFRNTRDCRTPAHNLRKTAFRGHGVYGESVALIGAGQIGRTLIKLLEPYRLHLRVVDPYLSEPEAEQLGVTRVSLEEAFAEAYVISNHLPNLPDLEKVLNGALFETMRPDATFINTGRGQQVNEAELIEVLQKRPDIFALLDVTFPEPSPADHSFYTLPNVQLSNHMAGAHDNEVIRMADTVIEEFTRWQNGDPLRYAITREMLKHMA